MGEGKQRDYSFDAIRGFCIFIIVAQHVIVTCSDFDYHSISGYLFFATDVFVMQVFFFLSGYFSKRPERGRRIAVKALLWPLLMTFLFFGVVQIIIDYDIKMDIYRPPLAMWFLLCLFYYRMFQVNYIKVKHIFGIVFLISLVVGMIPQFGKDFALIRAVSWMPYFLMGYYCSSEQMAKIRTLRWWQTSLIAVGLLAGIWAFLWYAPFDKYGAVQMLTNNYDMGISWWQNIVMRIALLIVSSLCILVIFNVFKRNRKGFWAYIGQHTMSVYIFHVILVFIIMKNDVGLGLITPPTYDTPLFITYCIGLSLIFTILLASPPSEWLYKMIFTKTYDLFIWCVHKIGEPVGGVVEKLFWTIWPLKDKRE